MAATSSLSPVLPHSATFSQQPPKAFSAPPSLRALCSHALLPLRHKDPATSPLSLNSLPFKAEKSLKRNPIFYVSAQLNKRNKPLKVMISGAPASGKGTQCELIVKHHSLVHVSAGDLLRAEIAAGTENGKKAKEYMTRGELVPNDIVVKMVKERLTQPDAQEEGWLLDGYPRSQSQADAIEAEGLRPDVFILLEVPNDVLIERVVGRRLDPVTGRIYHLKYSPPESEEISQRLTQRFDDTEEKANLRLQTHFQNVDAVVATYQGIIKKVDGNRPKDMVFQTIDEILSELLGHCSDAAGSRGQNP